ncbi:MAG: hypothetical protein ACRESW_10680, partial [Nevskiales bacterium]
MYSRRYPCKPLALAGVLVVFAALLMPMPAAAHAERMSFFPNTNAADTPRHARPVYRPSSSSLTAQRLVVCKRSGDEGVGAGEDSASRIAKMAAGSLKTLNQQLLAECTGVADLSGKRTGTGAKGFAHLQAAVDAVTQRFTNIYLLPGIYKEEPSVRALDERGGAALPADEAFCKMVFARGPGRLSYQEQLRCRHIQNTVAIFGDPDFTDDNCGDDIEGVCTNPDTQKCLTGLCQYYDLQIEGTGEKSTDVIFEGDFSDDGQFRYLNGIRADRADGIYL